MSRVLLGEFSVFLTALLDLLHLREGWRGQREIVTQIGAL
jgi:hypothetical protein